MNNLECMYQVTHLDTSGHKIDSSLKVTARFLPFSTLRHRHHFTLDMVYIEGLDGSTKPDAIISVGGVDIMHRESPNLPKRDRSASMQGEGAEGPSKKTKVEVGHGHGHGLGFSCTLIRWYRFLLLRSSSTHQVDYAARSSGFPCSMTLTVAVAAETTIPDSDPS